MRKKRRWNLFAILSLLLAATLAILALLRIDVTPVQSRDSLRLSTSSRALTVDPRQRPSNGWSTLRGDLLNASEAQDDEAALDAAPFRVQIGVYANTMAGLNLSEPSFASSGYVWMIWNEPLERYLQANGATIDQRFSLLNALITGCTAIAATGGFPTETPRRRELLPAIHLPRSLPTRSG